MNYVARERHIREIQSENIGIAKRLEKAQPVINVDDLVRILLEKELLSISKFFLNWNLRFNFELINLIKIGK